MRLKTLVAAALIVLVVIFTAQNTDVVEIRLFLWRAEMSRALMIFVVLLAGVAAGWILGGRRARR